MAHAAPFHEPALHETDVAARVAGDILHPSVEFQYIPETEQVPSVGVVSACVGVHPSRDHGFDKGLHVPPLGSLFAGLTVHPVVPDDHATAESEQEPAVGSRSAHPNAV